jgi:hypothetical protein
VNAAGQYGNKSSASKPAIRIYVLDVVIWLSGATKQMSPETVQRCFRVAKFYLYMSDLSGK